MVFVCFNTAAHFYVLFSSNPAVENREDPSKTLLGSSALFIAFALWRWPLEDRFYDTPPPPTKPAFFFNERFIALLDTTTDAML